MPASTKSSQSFFKKPMTCDAKNDTKSFGKGKTVVSKLGSSNSNSNLIKKGAGGSGHIQILVSK